VRAFGNYWRRMEAREMHGWAGKIFEHCLWAHATSAWVDFGGVTYICFQTFNYCAHIINLLDAQKALIQKRQ
jgi:hypothetical protein